MDEETLFAKAITIQAPQERMAFLQQACGQDTQLRAGVEKLLRLHAQAGNFLEEPPLAGGPELIGMLSENPEMTVAPDTNTGVKLDFLAPAEQPGSLGRLGKYDVESVIGHGGMGVVLKARDTKLGRTVAVKVLGGDLVANSTARQRFSREARAAAAVTHPHVITIHEVDDESVPYLVMEFVDGPTLAEKIQQEGMLEVKEILRIGLQIAQGLDAAHKQGLIHRDIKPANILLENGVERVMITDFGLARAGDDVGVTQTGEVSGTPQYMSPEQARGDAVDFRSDLFSLGSVLYAMCTGRSPFRADNTIASIRRVCDDRPRPIRQVNADIPAWLCQVVDKLLQKDPAKRFQTAQQLAEVLGRHLADLQHPRVAPARAAAAKTNHRNVVQRSWRWSIAASLFGLIVLLGVTEGIGVTDFASTMIRIVTGHGTLVVEVEDSDVDVSVDGENVKIRGTGVQELSLRPGQYRVAASKDGAPVTQELVTVARGGRRIVRVTLEPAPVTGRNLLSESASAGEERLAPSSRIPVGSSAHILTSDKWEWTKPENLGPVVNSQYVEGGPVLAADGLTLIFDSDRPGGEGGSDLWMSTRESPQHPWGQPINLGSAINGPTNETEACLSASGLTLVFTRFGWLGAGRTDLWLSTRESLEDSWSAPVNLAELNSGGNERCPALSADERTLIFGRGGGVTAGEHQKLWVATRDSLASGWSAPVELDFGLTGGRAGDPSIAADGLSLLFNRADALLWILTRATTEDAWSQPRQIGSDHRAPALSSDATTLLFESTRSGGQGASDLWLTRRVKREAHGSAVQQ